MKSCRSILFVFLMIFTLSGFAIDFSTVNIAWQYDSNAELKMQHRVTEKDGSIFILVRIETDSLAEFDYQFLIQNGYQSSSHESLEPVAVDTLLNEENLLILSIQLPPVQENLLVIRAESIAEIYYYDISLKIGSLPYPSVYPTDSTGVPIFVNYLHLSDFNWEGNSSFHAMQYREGFAPADAAMAEMKPLAPVADLVNSYVFSDSSGFQERHFYVVRADSNASSGVTMLRVPPYFPESRKLTELAESMLYITNETERKSLLSSKNLKSDFDSFWINNFNTKSRARNAIRKYYGSVKRANLLFTDFKPGWKTDRGMMYIIYGAPDEVYRTGSLEEWYYDSGDAFEFTIISSFFAPKTYALRRNKGLEDSWYQRIAAIRRGINE